MADGQQPGFGSFDDLDKFLKQKPAVSPDKQQAQPEQKKQGGGGFTDFASFDHFLTAKKNPQKPAEYKEVPFYTRPLGKWGERGAVSNEDMSRDLYDRFGISVKPDDPRIHDVWKSTLQGIDPAHHPFNFIEHVLSRGHKGAEWVSEKVFPTESEDLQSTVKLLQGALNEPSVKSDPEKKKTIESMLRMGQDKLLDLSKKEAQEGVSLTDPGVVARTIGTTAFDWESMGAIFKPLEMLGELSKAQKAARTALYAVNQAIGAKFSYDSLQEGNKLWKEGRYFEAMSAYGGSAAMLLMPVIHHVTNEKGITQEQIRKKAYDELEQKKKELQAAQATKPDSVLPITAKGIEDMQYRIANGLPMFGIGRPVPMDIPMPDVDALRVGDRNLQNRLERENLKTEAQRKIGKIEQEQRELAHKRRLATEQAKTEAEKRQLLAELDEREKQLEKDITAEKERFKTSTTGLQRPMQGPSAIEMPIPEKRPFGAMDPLEVLPGRGPMTREDREAEWLEERRKRYTDELAAEREERLRTGEDLKVEDKRRFAMEPLPEPRTGIPVEPQALSPTPGTEAPPPAAPAPLAPPPQTREEIQTKVTAAAWINQELELRKAHARPDEIALIEQQQEANRQLAGDLALDRIAEAMENRRKPATVKAGVKVEGPTGKSSELKTVARNYPIRYRVVEGAGLIPSHDPVNFEPVEGYPSGVQERDYKNDKDAQVAVIQHTQRYDPEFTLSDAPGPEHGPPMVTPDGIVLGGNSRAMSTVRLYREGGGDDYRKSLLERASRFGLDPAKIEGMKEPVLVREFLAPPTDIQGLRALGSDLNKVFTRKLSEFEQAVSAGKRLSPETLDYILNQLQELGDGATLRDLLRERPRGILEKLEADGVIASTERRQFIDEKTQGLNDAGKDFVENAILGSVVDDPLVLANAPKGILRKIERSLSSIARIKARGGAWDITDYVKEALREHIAATSAGVSIADHIDPPTAFMFPREPIHPIVEGIATKLDEDSAAVKKAFEGYAQDAEADVKGQGTMSFYAPPKPWESFEGNFGVDVKPQDWGTLRPISSTAKGSTPQDAGAASEREDEVLAPAPIEPPPSIGEIFDEEVARRKTEEPEERIDLGEIGTPPELAGSPSAVFRMQAEAAFPDISSEQMDAVMGIMEARARTVGKPLDKWIEEKKLSVEGHQASGEDQDLVRVGEQKLSIRKTRVKAHVEFMDDGRTIIRAFQKNNPSVAALVHELAHIFRRDLGKELSNKEWMALHDWAGVKYDPEYGAVWPVKAEEKFARGFERYLRDGETPHEGLRGIFDKFKEWMSGIYRVLKDSPLSMKFSPEIKKVFDRILTPPPDLSSKVKPRPLDLPPDVKAADRPKLEVGKKRLEGELEAYEDALRVVNEKGLEGVQEVYAGTDDLEVLKEENPEADPVVVAKERIAEEIESTKKNIDAVSKLLGEPKVEQKKREIEIPEPGPKKRYEPIDKPPRKSLGESLRGMTDDDVRTAAKSIESQMRRSGITPPAREQLEAQYKPFRDEMERRKILDRPEKGFGDNNAIFTKARAESARERLRKRLGTTLHSGVDPELVRDVSEIMGYYFEGGMREFASLSRKLVSEFGETVRPILQHAYDHMLNRGKIEAKTPDQRNLFEPVRQIVLPPGVEEVRRGPSQAREERPPSVPPREKVDVSTRPERREAVRQDPREATGSERGIGKPASGRAVRPTGEGVGGSGVVERFEQPLRAVQTPKLDVDHITDIPYTVEPTEWKGRLKDAKLPENLPPPTETLSPQVEAKLAFKGQPEIVQTVLTSLRKYHGAVLATSTGTGKTYMGSAILAEKRPRMALIVAPSQNIAKQWADTAQLFSVEVKPLEKTLPTEPGIYTVTYSTASNREGLDKINWDMLIADESHYARRWHDPSNQRGKFLIEAANHSTDVVYASATAFHTPLEVGYLGKLGLWKKTGLEPWLAKEFGVRQGEGGKWVVPMNYRKLAALRDELINRGMFVNLDRNMEGYTANFSVVPMTQQTMEGVRNATQAFRLAEEYFRQKGLQKMIMAVRGNAATFMKSFLERQRLPEAIELGKKLDREGWKVIYFTESKKEVNEIYDFLKPADEAFDGAISEKLPKLPSVVDTLKEAFGEDLADFTGAHSARRQSDLDEFNRGGKKHLIATYGAGGVGVSLHDLSGEAPRAVIYLGPPWSGVMFDQAIGRPWRFGTKSNVNAYFLTSNAQPEMKLIFQKVLPRFESLKASVSGIKKSDPIVGAMKDLDAYLAYEFGNDTTIGFDQFMNTLQTSAVSSYKEAPVSSAETAKNKGMQVERRRPLDEPPSMGPVKLHQEEDIPSLPPDLPSPDEAFVENDEKSASVLRRPFVPEQTEREISDPRLLDQVNDENMATMGLEGGGERPPVPPGEVYGTQQVQRPGDSEVRRDDLAAPKVMQRVYEFAEKHFGEWGVPIGMIDRLAKAEVGVRSWLAQMHTAPYVLRQFPETKKMVDSITHAEQVYKRDLGNMQYEKTKILQEYDLINDPIGRRKVDQALRMTDQGTSMMSLLGQPSKWLDGSLFKENELAAAQKLRDMIYEPVIEAVRNVRPEVGYRRKYSAVIKTMEDMVSSLYPELNGKVPADLISQFSLDVRRSMTRDPFSPHTLRRRGEPPKTWDIDDVLEAYLPSMLRVKHYTKLSRQVARNLAEIPDSMLKEYSTKYARIFFGVPSEYKRMDRARFNIARTITNLTYASALELNPLWYTMHLTKVPINTLPELGKNGGEYLRKGYSRMMTDEGRELVARSGLLMDRLWAFPETFYELKKRPQGWLRLTTSMSDFIDRSVSYLAALEKAKDMGFLGPKEAVGEITWKRLNELAANGVDTEKAFDYASSVMARSEFLYTPGHVQMWQREHPVLGMFKHFLFREAEFVSTIRKVAKEVKDHPDPEAYIQEQVSKGNYEYIDAVAKYRRILVSLAGAAAVAAGIGGPLFSRFWPFHMGRLLSPPIMFAADTIDLIRKTLNGTAKEDEWKSWAFDFFGSFTPGAGFAARQVDPYQKVTITKPRKHHRDVDFETPPAEKFQFEPLPQ